MSTCFFSFLASFVALSISSSALSVGLYKVNFAKSCEKALLVDSNIANDRKMFFMVADVFAEMLCVLRDFFALFASRKIRTQSSLRSAEAAMISDFRHCFLLSGDCFVAPSHTATASLLASHDTSI